MKLKVIGSSSSGNCYVLDAGSSCLVIEAGVPFGEVKKAVDFKVQNIHGLLISHSHQDHCKFTRDYVKAGIPVFTSDATFKAQKLHSYNTHVVEHAKEFQFSRFRVMPFDVKHDVPCFGFLIRHPQSGTIVFLTDAHYSPYRFINVNHWLIECNYDQAILDNNILNGKLPVVVRNRVMKSHLSLQTCKDLLKANDLRDTMNIVLLHLSNGNSNAKDFKHDIEGLTGKAVTVADKGIEMNLNFKPF